MLIYYTWENFYCGSDGRTHFFAAWTFLKQGHYGKVCQKVNLCLICVISGDRLFVNTLFRIRRTLLVQKIGEDSFFGIFEWFLGYFWEFVLRKIKKYRWPKRERKIIFGNFAFKYRHFCRVFIFSTIVRQMIWGQTSPFLKWTGLCQEFGLE